MVTLLSGLRGVIRAHVDWGAEGPEQVEVLAEARRSRAHVTRDVRTALATACGVDLAPERVRVVRIGSGDGGAERADTLRVEQVRVDRRRRGVEIRVRLRRGETVAEGARAGPQDARAEPRRAAEATLAAVERLLPDGRFALRDVQEVGLGGQRVVVVALSARWTVEARPAFGLAPVTGRRVEAVARAVVSAIQGGSLGGPGF